VTKRLVRRWAAAALITAGVWWLGRRSLPAPPLFDPARWSRWWQTVGPLRASLSLVRAGVLAVVTVWVLIVTAVMLTTHVPASRAVLVRWGERIRVGGWSGGSAVRLVVGLATAGAVVGGCSSRGGAGSPVPPMLADLGPSFGTSEPAPPPVNPVSVKPPAPPVASPPAPPVRPPAPPVRATTVDSVTHQWSVRPGDDLWSIAASTLSRAAGEPDPTERAIAAYWLEVMQANRGWLKDPNLIFPGEVVTLPPIT
jgi:hypothetical protein